MKYAQMMGVAVLIAAGSALGQLQNPVPPGATQLLTQAGPDGKLQLLDGFVELKALKESAAVNAAIREKAKPLALNWLLDIQQQVIDNLDFMAQIEPFDGKPGFFDTFDPQNAKDLERIGAFAKQLGSTGPLLNMLAVRRVLDTPTEQSVRQLVYDYDLTMMRQFSGEGKDVMASTRYQYKVAYRDSVGMFHSLLDRAATKIDDVVAGAKLTPEQAAAVAPAVGQVKAAKDKAEVRMAMKGLLKGLPLLQQRAVLMKTRDLVPITDPNSVL